METTELFRHVVGYNELHCNYYERVLAKGAIVPFFVKSPTGQWEDAVVYKRTHAPFTKIVIWKARMLRDCDLSFFPDYAREMYASMFFKDELKESFLKYCDRFPLNTYLIKPMSKSLKKIKIY